MGQLTGFHMIGTVVLNGPKLSYKPMQKKSLLNPFESNVAFHVETRRKSQKGIIAPTCVQQT